MRRGAGRQRRRPGRLRRRCTSAGGHESRQDREQIEDEKLRSARFVPVEDLPDLASPRIARRMTAAVHARRLGTVIELVDGERVQPPEAA